MSYSLGLAAGRPAPAGILAFSGFVPVVEGWEPSFEGRERLRAFVAHGRNDPVMEIGVRAASARAPRGGRRRRRVPRVRGRALDRPGARRRSRNVARGDAATGMTIRELTADDLPFLRDMLVAALDWRPGGVAAAARRACSRTRRSSSSTRAGGAPATRASSPRRTAPVGAVWWRLFTEDAHGEGFVDERTPELAIAVVDGPRPRDRPALMEAMHEHGRRAGVARVSLSVEPENPAKTAVRAARLRRLRAGRRSRPDDARPR